MTNIKTTKNWKVVFYGAEASGKTTNLEVIFEQTPTSKREQITSLSTKGNQTFYYDFISFDLDNTSKVQAKFQLYTVPGQASCSPIRKFILQQVDAIVFVVDSQEEKMEENLASLRELQNNLKALEIDIETIPFVFQYNKRDLPNAMELLKLNRMLNPWEFRYLQTIATKGEGVFQSLKAIIRMLLAQKKKQTAVYSIPGSLPSASLNQTSFKTVAPPVQRSVSPQTNYPPQSYPNYPPQSYPNYPPQSYPTPPIPNTYPPYLQYPNNLQSPQSSPLANNPSFSPSSTYSSNYFKPQPYYPPPNSLPPYPG